MAFYVIHNDSSYPGEPGPSDEPTPVEPTPFQGSWRDCLAEAVRRRDSQYSEGCFFITGDEIGTSRNAYYRVVGSFAYGRENWTIQDSYKEQLTFDSCPASYRCLASESQRAPADLAK